jgi:hypothetical protein
MNPYTKAALFLIRMIAFGCILCSLLLLASYVFYLRAEKKPDDGVISLILKTLPLLVGFVLLCKSGAIAKKLTEQFDE